MSDQDLPPIQALDDPINRRIWDLHIRGRTPVAKILDDVGLRKDAVYDRIKKITDSIPAIEPEEVATYRQVTLARLEENEAVLQQAFLRTAALMQGDGDAPGQIDHLGLSRLNTALIRIDERRAKLVGMDAPKRVQLEGLQTSPIEDVFGVIDRTIADAEEWANADG